MNIQDVFIARRDGGYHLEYSEVDAFGIVVFGRRRFPSWRRAVGARFCRESISASHT